MNNKILIVSANYYREISKNFWIVEGTPTDCMIFALNHIFKKNKPDLILSGINAGSNIGDEVSYSGTVAAAWEGAVRRIDSVSYTHLTLPTRIFV